MFGDRNFRVKFQVDTNYKYHIKIAIIATYNNIEIYLKMDYDMVESAAQESYNFMMHLKIYIFTACV